MARCLQNKFSKYIMVCKIKLNTRGAHGLHNNKIKYTWCSWFA